MTAAIAAVSHTAPGDDQPMLDDQPMPDGVPAVSPSVSSSLDLGVSSDSPPTSESWAPTSGDASEMSGGEPVSGVAMGTAGVAPHVSVGGSGSPVSVVDGSTIDIEGELPVDYNLSPLIGLAGTPYPSDDGILDMILDNLDS